MNYIEKITEEMKQQKITASKMEEDLDLGKGMVSAWKRGTQPTVEKLLKVINYLGLSADELFGIKGTRNVIMTVPSYSYDTRATLKFIIKSLKYAKQEKSIDDISDYLDGIIKISENEIETIERIAKESHL